MGVSSVLVSVLLTSSVCFGFLPFKIDCECRTTRGDQAETEIQSPFSEVEKAITRDERTAKLVDTVLASLEDEDHATFQNHVTSEFARETVWKVLARPNRTIRGSQIVALDDSALYLILDIEDDEGVKERIFELKTAMVGEDLVVSDWVYVRR